jgi:LCP family protein required for cell wall assembly
VQQTDHATYIDLRSPESSRGRREAAPWEAGSRTWTPPPDGGPPAGSGRDPRRVVVGNGPGGPGGPREPRGPGGGGRHRRREPPDGYGEDEAPRRHRRSWLQRLVLSAGVALVIFCLLGAAVGSWALVKYYSIDREDLVLGQAAKGDPRNFLLVAPDTRDGHSGENSDTMMILRVDPQSDRVALTSLPRDLMVEIADTGEVGMLNGSFAREGSKGPQNLIDTIKLNYDMTIHHYIKVEWDSFQQVVDAVGGVPIWIPYAARDRHSGFYTEAHQQCVTLQGEEALEFVRSRYMEVLIDGEWRHDPLSDVHRVERQKIFVMRAMTDALAEVKSNPLRVTQLIDIGTANVTLDEHLGLGELRDLANQFKSFDASKIESYPLPVEPWPQNDQRLVLDEAGAEPMLNVFRGLPPGEIRPQLVEVEVLNGTVLGDEAQVREGLAMDVSGALDSVGFDVLVPGDADDGFYEHTTIEHAPGGEVHAERLARHITSDVAIPLRENPDLPDGRVRLVAGADFTTVHEAPTPDDAMPGAAEPAPDAAEGADASGEAGEGDASGTEPEGAAGAGGSGTSGPADGESSNDSPTTTAPSTTTTTVDPYVIGVPPEGKSC